MPAGDGEVEAVEGQRENERTSRGEVGFLCVGGINGQVVEESCVARTWAPTVGAGVTRGSFDAGVTLGARVGAMTQRSGNLAQGGAGGPSH
jgi:hypothetical protein